MKNLAVKIPGRKVSEKSRSEILLCDPKFELISLRIFEYLSQEIARLRTFCRPDVSVSGINSCQSLVERFEEQSQSPQIYISSFFFASKIQSRGVRFSNSEH